LRTGSTAALRDFDPAYARFGSNASDRHACDLRATYAFTPILLQKYFEHFDREILIQNRAQARNVDLKERSSRFDGFKFQFHSICSVTFATVSLR
jgi:hypothetical protein